LKKRIVIVVFLILLVGVGCFVYVGQKEIQTQESYYSGTIEATTSELSFQVNGGVAQVLVEEGARVVKDEPLALLDDSLYKARHDQSLANLDTARKNLRRMETVLELYQATLPAEVERAESAVAVIRSQLQELNAGYRKQEIERARLAYLEAKEVMEEAAKDKIRYERLYEKNIVSEKSRDVVILKYDSASKALKRARETFDMFQEGTRKETVRTAEAKLAEGKAALREAKMNLKKIETAWQDVEQARSQIEVAESAVALAAINLDYTLLRAPFGGTVISRNVEPGEVVTSGREVLTLADLSTVHLKIFVDEQSLGKVKIGQKAEVRTDTFPDKIYKGRVSFISPQGEFTPKIIQTHKERVKLVYRVKISIPNPEGELKTGMPADAWLRE
jgi:HlyD family secretion protein